MKLLVFRDAADPVDADELVRVARRAEWSPRLRRQREGTVVTVDGSEVVMEVTWTPGSGAAVATIRWKSVFPLLLGLIFILVPIALLAYELYIGRWRQNPVATFTIPPLIAAVGGGVFALWLSHLRDETRQLREIWASASGKVKR